MKKTIVILIALILCLCCSASIAEQENPEKDIYYLGTMKVVNCRRYVSLREFPDKTSEALAEIPLGSFVYNCTRNVKMYAPGRYRQQYDLFIRCEYNGQTGYILKKFLTPAPEYEPAETKQNDKMMTREEITGNTEENRQIIIEWQEYNLAVLASREITTENDRSTACLRIGCFIDDEPAWGYTETVRLTDQIPVLTAFMGGTEDEPQVYVYNAEKGLTMIDLMDGTAAWTLAKEDCPLGDAAVHANDKDTGDLYIAGTEGPDPVAISAEGIVLWRSELGDEGVYGPREIRLEDEGIRIYYENGKTVMLDYDGDITDSEDD